MYKKILIYRQNKLSVYRLILSYCTSVIGKSSVFPKSIYVQMTKCREMLSYSELVYTIYKVNQRFYSGRSVNAVKATEAFIFRTVTGNILSQQLE